jgi:hypothetical protein
LTGREGTSTVVVVSIDRYPGCPVTGLTAAYAVNAAARASQSEGCCPSRLQMTG